MIQTSSALVLTSLLIPILRASLFTDDGSMLILLASHKFVTVLDAKSVGGLGGEKMNCVHDTSTVDGIFLRNKLERSEKRMHETI